MLAHAPCSAWALGEVLLCPPLGVYRSCILSAQALIAHMPPPLTIVTLNLIYIISPSGLGLVTYDCTMIVTAALLLRKWTTGTGIPTIPPLTPSGTLLLGLLWQALIPFKSCHQLLLHFNPF